MRILPESQGQSLAMTALYVLDFLGSAICDWEYGRLCHIRSCHIRSIVLHSIVSVVGGLNILNAMERSYLTECIERLVSESQLLRKIVNLLFNTTNRNTELTVLWGS